MVGEEWLAGEDGRVEWLADGGCGCGKAGGREWWAVMAGTSGRGWQGGMAGRRGWQGGMAGRWGLWGGKARGRKWWGIDGWQ